METPVAWQASSNRGERRENMADLVQVRNPRTNRFVLVDRDQGKIIEHKETDGPYVGVPFDRRAKTQQGRREVRRDDQAG